MSFDYNSSGLRTKKTVNGEEKQYFYSGDLLISEYNGLEYMNFTYGPDGEPVGFSFYDAEENEPLDYYFYFKNIQGDILGLLDHQGAIYCTYSYDAWGKLLGAYDRNGNEITNPNHAAYRNPLRYRGYYYDDETGLYYLNSRYYNPEWGTFICADDTEYLGADGTLLAYNLFAYCGNNPINRFDKTGNLWLAIGLFVGGSALIGGLTGALTSASTQSDVLEGALEGVALGAVAATATVLVPVFMPSASVATAVGATFLVSSIGGFLVDLSTQIISHELSENAEEKLVINKKRLIKTSVSTGIAGVVPTYGQPSTSVINAVCSLVYGFDASVINSVMDIVLSALF